MATIVDKISLDVSRQNLIPPIQAKQFDSDSRFLDVTVLQNGEKITVDSGATVYLNIERADHEKNSYTGTVNEDGTVRVPLTRWALSLDDIVTASVSIIQNDTRLTTLSFMIDVQVAESNDAPSPDPPDVWEQVLIDVAHLNAHALEDTDIVTTVSSSSTNSQIPSAKCLYDTVQAALYVDTDTVIIPAEV